jgi:hypothetical protein
MHTSSTGVNICYTRVRIVEFYQMFQNVESAGSCILEIGRFLRQIAPLFMSGGTPPLQACDTPLTNLKSRLIMGISKPHSVDGKRETHGGARMKVGYIRPRVAQRDAYLTEAALQTRPVLSLSFLMRSEIPLEDCYLFDEAGSWSGKPKKATSDGS